jgi:hypothetical protein
MADTKVSELPVATSVSDSDLLYLVQNVTSKRVTVGTLFENLNNVSLTGNVSYSSDVQTITYASEIDINTPVTLLQADASGGELILPEATKENQIKILVMTSTEGGAYHITERIANGKYLSFYATGDTATLMYVAGNWYLIGGTATLS